MSCSIIMKGMRRYNLKNLDFEIPGDKLIGVTGPAVVPGFIISLASSLSSLTE